MKSPIWLILITTGLFLTSLVQGEAQTDPGHVFPKQLPKNPTIPVIPEAPVPSKRQDQAKEVLIEKVKGLVFVPTPHAVNKSGLRAKGIVLQNVKVPNEPGFKTLVAPYLGQNLTRGKLDTLITAIIIFYREHDRPVVDVIVPEQDITNGVLQLVLLEGKMGAVKVTGNRWFSSDEIADGITLRPGAPISANRLQSDLDWVNSNPFHSSELVYTPGQKMGETDLVLQTHDRFPVRPYLGYNNDGNPQTGFDRYLVGFNYGDLFGIGQQLNYQYTTSGDIDSLRANSGSYVVPLPWHHTLTFFGSYVATKGAVPPLIGLKGRSYQISARYSVPLPTLTYAGELAYKQSIAGGFDYKYNNNSLEFGGTPAPGTLYTVNQFVLAYNGTETDPYGQTTINDQLYLSPGNWGADNSDANFNNAHTGASSSYVYNTLILERLTRLPFDWSLLLRGTVQTSDGNLVPSEQLGFGGFDSVRGYDEREVNTDEGFIFTTELHTPTVSLGDALGWKAFQDQLQFLGFWDYGAAHNHTLLPGETGEIPLSSLGFGLRYSINTYVTVRFDYGFQLLSTGFDTDHGGRADVGVVVSY